MTNEEIERAVEEAFDGFSVKVHPITERRGLTACVDLDADRYDELRRDIAARVRELVSQAYEEAAATLCEGCRSGIPIDPSGDWKYPRHLGPELCRLPCAARAIRALKDSLVQTPASSS
jgi:hypothetical protein